MNRKSKIIVSVVGISIVLLALLGITYAYYLTRIQGNTNTNSISVSTADLKLVYGDGNGLVTANDIMPGTTITKTFTVTNAGESKVENYVVVLESIVNTLTRTQDLKYTLTCKFNNGDSCGKTEELIFPSGVTEKAIFLNSIDKDVTHNYTLTVNYVNLTETDQSTDMGSSISALVNIKDSKEIDITGLRNPSDTLAKTILASYGGENAITEVTDFSTVTTGLYKAEDDYGTSYYFRGDVTNNYVKFGTYSEKYSYYTYADSNVMYSDNENCNVALENDGYVGLFECEEKIIGNSGDSMYWKIVRINGDGTIRLIYNGTSINAEDPTIGNGYYPYYNSEDSLEGLGYTHEDSNGVLQEDGTYQLDSTIKAYIDNWYNKYLNNYSSYIADSIFCNDRVVYEQKDSNLYFSSYNRLYTNKSPNLICSQDNDKYTVSDEFGNGYLTHPIALITGDELLMSGLLISNSNSYLVGENSSPFWSMTPNYRDITVHFVWRSSGFEQTTDGISNSLGSSTRPVINLNASVNFTIDEDGTYVITTS